MGDRPHRRVDRIVMLDVLEHLEDDLGILLRLRDLLTPGGHRIIKVPALPFLYSPMDAAIGHFRRYGRKSLKHVLQQAGFGEVRLRSFNMPGILGWWLNGKVLQRTVPPKEQINGFNVVVPFIQWMEAVIPPPLGLSLFAVAKIT